MNLHKSLLVPKVRMAGYIPFWVTERKRSELALIQVVQKAYVQGVSTRKIEKLAKSLGISCGWTHCMKKCATAGRLVSLAILLWSRCE